MGKRHPNPKLVKIHRSYSVEDIANLFGIHKNTVRLWLKQGLEAIDKSHPILVHGKILAVFIVARRKNSKQPCPPGHLYCLRCRVPKLPAENMVDFTASNEATVNVSAICPTCSGMMYQRVKKQRLAEYSTESKSAFTEPQSRIKESNHPSVNCDFKGDCLT
jgi:hypothetical protein